MATDSHEITMAFWALGDYFSRLGGSARYFNMPESDIPLFIGCELAKRISPEFDQREYVVDVFVKAANPVMAEVQSHLGKVVAESEELTPLIYEFVRHIDNKLKPQDRSARWERFVAWVDTHTPNNSLLADGPGGLRP